MIIGIIIGYQSLHLLKALIMASPYFSNVYFSSNLRRLAWPIFSRK